jgi:peroxiredoxin
MAIHASPNTPRSKWARPAQRVARRKPQVKNADLVAGNVVVPAGKYNWKKEGFQGCMSINIPLTSCWTEGFLDGRFARSSLRRVHGRSPARNVWWPRAAARRWASAAVGVAVLVAGCAAANSGGHPITGGAIPLGAQLFPVGDRQQLPPIAGKTLTGANLALRSFAGRSVLVLNVWASWCANCRDESAALAKLSHSFGPATASFVGIDEQDVASAARRFVTSTGTGYPQLADPDGTTLNRLTLLPSSGIPSTLVVDRQGNMAARIVGPVTAPQLQKLIGVVAAES